MPLPESIEEKKALVLGNGLALWDVIGECDIIGASDSSVKNVVPTDIPSLLAHTGETNPVQWILVKKDL